MCIQSYYNKQKGEDEIELDLLKEIKDFGIDEWNEQVSRERASAESKRKGEPEKQEE